MKLDCKKLTWEQMAETVLSIHDEIFFRLSFPRRWKTAEAAMKAVDRLFSIAPQERSE